MLEISVHVSQKATQLVKDMPPGDVFTHNGKAFLKVFLSGDAVYLRNVDDGIQQVGETPDPILPFQMRAFSNDAYGRVVTLAELKIEL